VRECTRNDAGDLFGFPCRTSVFMICHAITISTLSEESIKDIHVIQVSILWPSNPLCEFHTGESRLTYINLGMSGFRATDDYGIVEGSGSLQPEITLSFCKPI